MTATTRPVWADVDLSAVRHNLEVLRRVTGTSVMAVVKADAYGHGAVPVARAAVEAGAERLAVALVEEAQELRDAGITAPIHLLSEPPVEAAPVVVSLRLTPTAYTAAFIDAVSRWAGRMGSTVPVHVKVDTGMHRVGAAPAEAVDLARRVARSRGLRLEGVWTHLAVAEKVGHPATAAQLGALDRVLGALEGSHVRPDLVHAANSAGALAVPQARRDLVRIGISLYGVVTVPGFTPDPGLRPVMSVRARVSYVKRLPAGESVSYGLTYTLPRDANMATVPIGYADGYARRLSNRAAALVRGRRVPVAGTVTMDQILLDCGDLPVEAGDEVVLLGRQGDEEVTATELADLLDTIPYEVLCAVGKRIPRRYSG